MSLSVLYIGNKLQKHGFTPTSIETLGERMKEFAQVSQVSDKKNFALRILHMWWAALTCRKGSKVVIDTYSTVAFNFAWTTARILQMRGIPYIPVLRGGDLPNRYDRSPAKVKKYFDHAQAIIAPSQYLKQTLEKKWGGQIDLIPNYIEIENYDFLERKSIKPNLLWVRAFHETYNPHMAVDLLKSILHKYPDAQLCMVGPDKDGTMETTRQYAGEQGVLTQLKITGRLSKPDWLALSKEYDVFVNTTNFDNTPVSVIEAMALGLPVVTTNAGGIPYLFENGKEGIQTPVGDVEAMSNAVIKVIESPSQSFMMTTKARELVDNFSWTHVKQQWIEVLSA